MAIAEEAYVLWRRFSRQIPGEPSWPNRASYTIRGLRAASVKG
jgi:hypothetical protein